MKVICTKCKREIKPEYVCPCGVEPKRKPDENGVLPLTKEELKQFSKLIEDVAKEVRVKFGGIEYKTTQNRWMFVYEIKAILWLAERFDLEVKR